MKVDKKYISKVASRMLEVLKKEIKSTSNLEYQCSMSYSVPIKDNENKRLDSISFAVAPSNYETETLTITYGSTLSGSPIEIKVNIKKGYLRMIGKNLEGIEGYSFWNLIDHFDNEVFTKLKVYKKFENIIEELEILSNLK